MSSAELNQGPGAAPRAGFAYRRIGPVRHAGDGRNASHAA